MNEYIVLDQLIIKLIALLGASLLLERILVVLNISINRLFMCQYADRYTPAEKLNKQIMTEIKADRESNTIIKEDGEAKIEEEKAGDKLDAEEIDFSPEIKPEKRLSTDTDVLLIKPLEEIADDAERLAKYKEINLVQKDFWLQIFGTMLAIAACFGFKFSIWGFFEFTNTGIFPDSPTLWEYVFTGIIIGSGSKPMNFLMNFIINRKIEVDAGEIKEESKKVEDTETAAESVETGTASIMPPAVHAVRLNTIEELIGFEYDGGDRPHRLENTHKYNKKIDLIVYHHTTMHSDAPFKEVVKEFDRKGWLTGYHCVVFKDGAIRTLCRWDRFGNHVKYHNAHSFGIAFQGNYEPNPNVPASNPDGRYGILIPTKEQLSAAARLTAMYAIMKKIPPKFYKTGEVPNPVAGIMRHRQIARKACPGSKFPKEEFESMIESYHKKWERNRDFNASLKIFVKKPMVTI